MNDRNWRMLTFTSELDTKYTGERSNSLLHCCTFRPFLVCTDNHRYVLVEVQNRREKKATCSLSLNPEKQLEEIANTSETKEQLEETVNAY